MDAWEGDLTPTAAAGRSAVRVAARTRSTRYYSREATARLPQPVHEAEKSPVLPELKVVTKRRPRWSVALVTLAFAGLLLGASIVAPVLINSAATGVESAVGRMETQQKELAAGTAALSARISALSSPDRVAEQAAQLGLGPAQSVHYVGTGTGTAATEGDTTVAGR
jgi:cell division protein FtsL